MRSCRRFSNIYNSYLTFHFTNDYEFSGRHRYGDGYPRDGQDYDSDDHHTHGRFLAAKKFTPKTIDKVQPYLSSMAIITLSLMLLGLSAQGAPSIRANLDLTFRFFLSVVALGIILPLAGYYLFPFVNHRIRTGISVSSPLHQCGTDHRPGLRYFPEKVMIFTLLYMIPANFIPEVIKRLSYKANLAEEKKGLI